MKSKRAVVAAIGMVIVLVGAAGCSSDKVVSAKDAEAKLVAAFKDKAPGVKIGKASCPSGVKLTEGGTFKCTLQVANVTVPYTVTMSDIKGTKFHYGFKTTKVIIDLDAAASLVKNNLNEASQGATVVCGDQGDQFLLAKVGDTFRCHLSLGSQTGTNTLKVLDSKGTVKIVG